MNKRTRQSSSPTSYEHCEQSVPPVRVKGPLARAPYAPMPKGPKLTLPDAASSNNVFTIPEAGTPCGWSAPCIRRLPGNDEHVS